MINCIGCKFFGLCRITNKHAKIWCLQDPNWEPRDFRFKTLKDENILK